MIFKNFEIHAEPFFTKAYCPKCKGEVVELQNGFFSKAWYCEKCKVAYTLGFVKIPDKQVDKKGLHKQLAEIKKRERTVEC